MHPKDKIERESSGTHYSNGWNLVRKCSTAAQWM
jgi:phosphoribosylaminoimidazole (AIR) synthetase